MLPVSLVFCTEVTVSIGLKNRLRVGSSIPQYSMSMLVDWALKTFFICSLHLSLIGVNHLIEFALEPICFCTSIPLLNSFRSAAPAIPPSLRRHVFTFRLPERTPSFRIVSGNSGTRSVPSTKKEELPSLNRRPHPQSKTKRRKTDALDRSATIGHQYKLMLMLKIKSF